VSLLSFLTRRRQRRAVRLYNGGHEALGSYDFESALKIGRELRKLRYSGAYEIEGLAFIGLDRHEDAVRVLREGLALAPAAWPNWLLLGSCLSDLERYSEALVAYDRAYACDGADRPAVDLNRAIVAVRQKDYAAALRLLDGLQCENREMELRAIVHRVDALRGAGREAEAEELATRTLTNESEGGDDIGSIACNLGEMRLARGEDVRTFAIDFWRRTRHAPLLALIRDARPMRSDRAHYFRLLLHGTRFYQSVDVVADSPEEALTFVTELEPEHVVIDEATAIEPRPHDRKGVYRMTGRTYYEET